MQEVIGETIGETSSVLRNRKILSIKNTLKNISIIRKNKDKIQQKCKSTNDEDEISSVTKNYINQEQCISQMLYDVKKASLFQQKYQILQKIGEGANGFVNKCRKIKNGKIYAVKSLMMEEQNILQLKNNFFAIKQLKNPNIIQYKALYIDMRKKLCYLVMEYVNLPSLEKVKIKNLQEIKNILYTLLQTVKYMHQRNVCHRDLKPSNIIYDQKNKKIKIIDFGSSKKFFARHKKFEMLTITGTLFYRAPQIFIGGGYDQKVDIWSIGVILYKLICGRTPFQSFYLSDTIHNIVQKQVQFDESWQKSDNILKNFIKRMLKKQKSKRLNASQCMKDAWLYSKVFLHQTELTKSYQEFSTVKKIAPELKCGEITRINKLQTVNYVIQEVDGQDYHQIDSDDQNKCEFKSEKILSNIQPDKNIKIKSFHSLIF